MIAVPASCCVAIHGLFQYFKQRLLTKNMRDSSCCVIHFRLLYQLQYPLSTVHNPQSTTDSQSTFPYEISVYFFDDIRILDVANNSSHYPYETSPSKVVAGLKVVGNRWECTPTTDYYLKAMTQHDT